MRIWTVFWVGVWLLFLSSVPRAGGSGTFADEAGPTRDFCIVGGYAFFYGNRLGNPSAGSHLWRFNLRTGGTDRALTDRQEKAVVRDQLVQLTACAQKALLAGITYGVERIPRSQRIFTEIVLVDLPTSRVELIVANGRYNMFPQFSPDGSAIAFYDASADLEMNKWDPNFKGFAVSVVDVATKGIRRVAQEDWRHTRDSPPAWSPQGQQVAFSACYDKGGGSQIYVADLTAAIPTRISPADMKGCEYPVWSDVATVLYYGSRSKEYGIYASPPDGSVTRHLFPCSVRTPPDLSPDRAKIAFLGAAASSDMRKSEVIVLDLSGQRLMSEGPKLVSHRWRR